MTTPGSWPTCTWKRRPWRIVEASRTRGLDTGVLDAVHALMTRTIAAGHGADGFSRVIDAIREGNATAAA